MSKVISSLVFVFSIQFSFPSEQIRCRRREEKQNGEIPFNSSLSNQRSLKTKSNANDEEPTEKNLRLTEVKICIFEEEIVSLNFSQLLERMRKRMVSD